jgi:hypothetical protein
MIQFMDGPLAGERHQVDVVHGRILVRLPTPERLCHLYRLETPEQATFVITGRTDWFEQLLRIN